MSHGAMIGVMGIVVLFWSCFAGHPSDLRWPGGACGLCYVMSVPAALSMVINEFWRFFLVRDDGDPAVCLYGADRFTG
jgi:hypothetical protein